jgi:hypothetical protein
LEAALVGVLDREYGGAAKFLVVLEKLKREILKCKRKGG